MNLNIAAVALAFGLLETWYFGFNIFPGSDAEIICDGIVAVIFAMAFIRVKPI